MQVESSAAKALSDWQTAFSEQSIQRAKEIARESGASQIKSSHIRVQNHDVFKLYPFRLVCRREADSI